MMRLVLAVGGALILAGGIAIVWRGRGSEKKAGMVPALGSPTSAAVAAHEVKVGSPGPAAISPSVATGLTPAEKAARVEKIKRDYEEMRAKIGADYAAAGALYPESVPAFLRQLALLEREKRFDFASVLTPEELEELEWRETAAGVRVRQFLGDTAASEAQRRAVFRLQREFDLRFALSFEVTPAALLERETARQDTQEKIRLTLGDGLFAAWAKGTDEAFAPLADYVTKKNLPAPVALELWRIKNDFTREQLELRANGAMSAEQRRGGLAVLVRQAEARIAVLVGHDALEKERAGVLGWLPGR